MVTLLLGEGANLAGEDQCVGEAREGEEPLEPGDARSESRSGSVVVAILALNRSDFRKFTFRVVAGAAQRYDGDAVAVQAPRHERSSCEVSVMRKSCWFGCLLVLAAGSAAPAREASCPTPLPPGRYYIVTRPDPRECPAPVCGGYFVKEVNKPSTRCADGSWQADCHAGVIDESALAWSDEDRARFDLAFGQSEALAHGVLRPRATVTQGDVLAVDEAWLGQARSKPRGIFRGLVDNGMECVTVPCAWINARKRPQLRRRAAHHRRRLRGFRGHPEQVAAANEALGAPPGVLAAGPLRRVDDDRPVVRDGGERVLPAARAGRAARRTGLRRRHRPVVPDRPVLRPRVLRSGRPRYVPDAARRLSAGLCAAYAAATASPIPATAYVSTRRCRWPTSARVT